MEVKMVHLHNITDDLAHYASKHHSVSIYPIKIKSARNVIMEWRVLSYFTSLGRILTILLTGLFLVI